jgi:hypothetical protein
LLVAADGVHQAGSAGERLADRAGKRTLHLAHRNPKPTRWPLLPLGAAREAPHIARRRWTPLWQPHYG